MEIAMSDNSAYWEGLSPREKLLFDLLQVGVSAALGGDKDHAARIIEGAWQSADRIHPAADQQQN